MCKDVQHVSLPRMRTIRMAPKRTPELVALLRTYNVPKENEAAVAHLWRTAQDAAKHVQEWQRRLDRSNRHLQEELYACGTPAAPESANERATIPTTDAMDALLTMQYPEVPSPTCSSPSSNEWL